MIASSPKFAVDPIHIKDIHPAKFDSNHWKKGDLFISLGHQSMIILFRPSTQQIIWKLSKEIFHQHDVNILNSHEISIFNNNSLNTASSVFSPPSKTVLFADIVTTLYSNTPSVP